MEALQKRVTARLSEERKELQEAQMGLGRQRVQLSKEFERYMATVVKLAKQLADGQTIKPADAAKLREAETALARITRTLEANAAATGRNAAELTRLENGKELQRRLKLAQRLGVGEPVRGPEAAEIILLHSDGPLTVTQITRTALETGVLKLTGKTPSQTISGYLSKATKRGDRFVRVGPAQYDLKNRKKSQPKAKTAA